MEIVEAAGINVALVAGRCAGADFARLLEADLRIAGDGATFSAGGVAEPVACAVRLTRLLGEAAAKELLLADRTADAANALRLGLVTRVVPGSALGETARDVAERLRSAVAGRLFGSVRLRVTISLGVAVGPDDGLAVAEIIRVADDRLFQAKSAGRNRVVAPQLPARAAS